MRTRRKVGILAAVAAVVAALLGIPGSPARADLFNPRQQWPRESTAGVFLHWGERTSPAQTNCTTRENSIANGGGAPDYWGKEPQKLRASHKGLGTIHHR